MGPKGKTPWITLNGVDTADSQLCLELLTKHFNKDFSSHLTEQDRAIARAMQIMVEEHLYWYYQIPMISSELLLVSNARNRLKQGRSTLEMGLR